MKSTKRYEGKCSMTGCKYEVYGPANTKEAVEGEAAFHERRMNK